MFAGLKLMPKSEFEADVVVASKSAKRLFPIALLKSTDTLEPIEKPEFRKGLSTSALVNVEAEFEVEFLKAAGASEIPFVGTPMELVETVCGLKVA